MPKDAQHVAWLNAAYLTFPVNDKPWRGRTKHFADACNAAHLPATAQGIDGVDSQIVGRHFSECRAKAENIPRAVRMTPEQNDVLQEAYILDPYPSPGARMIIMQQTGLNYKQVKHWYEQKAKVLRKQSGVSASHTASNRYATQMWREYNKDERSYVEKLRNGSICPVTGKDLTQQGSRNNRSIQSTFNSSNAQAVQPNLGSVEHGMTFGIGPQPVQHLEQAGYYPMPTQTLDQMNQHGLSGLQNTHNYMQMQAQNQANNMPPHHVNTMPPHHGIYPVANVFAVGPDYAGYDLQQVAYPESNIANNPGPNTNPAYQDHGYLPFSNHQYGNTPANYQPAISGDQFAAQSFPAPEKPQNQRKDPVDVPRVEYRFVNEFLHQKPESVDPCRKRTRAMDEDDVEDTPRPEKRHRKMASVQKLPLAPSESDMSNAGPLSESNQAIPHEEFGATPRKRRVASVRNNIGNNGQSIKHSRSRRQMKPLPSVEYQRRHGLNFDLSEEHANEAAPRNEEPISNTASNAMGISGNSPPGIVYSNLEATYMQDADSSTIFARPTGSAAESMHSEDGEFDIDSGDHGIESPAQELPLTEDPMLPQPESQYPELPLDNLANAQGPANFDNFLPPSQIMTSGYNLGPINDFNYDEAFAYSNFQLNDGREYILGAENRET